MPQMCTWLDFLKCACSYIFTKETVKIKPIWILRNIKQQQSTKTALLKVTNYLLMASDSRHLSVLLDLNASLDTINHLKLINGNRLKDWVGISGVDLLLPVKWKFWLIHLSLKLHWSLVACTKDQFFYNDWGHVLSAKAKENGQIRN